MQIPAMACNRIIMSDMLRIISEDCIGRDFKKFWNASVCCRHGGYGPFFYLPKMQHSREAAVWNSVFEHAEDSNGAPQGSIRGTVLIETLPAVFQMHEILYELREHSAGLNCGRWDYIFSFIKTVRAHPDRLLPDRAGVGGTAHSTSLSPLFCIQ